MLCNARVQGRRSQALGPGGGGRGEEDMIMMRMGMREDSREFSGWKGVGEGVGVDGRV